MAVQLVSFSNSKFKVANAWLRKSAIQFGIKHVISFTDLQFRQTNFYQEHLGVASRSFGAGYFIWKPYYILECLKKMAPGDVLIYADSGLKIIAKLEPLLSIAAMQDITLFENYQGSSYISKTTIPFTEYNCYTELNKNRYWCKRDCFILMELDEEKYLESPQVDASFMIFKNTPLAISLVEKWLQYCTDERIVTGDANTLGQPDYSNFIGHIYDQSVLSLLAGKYDIELFRCPSQFGNHYKMPAYRIAGEELLLPYAKASKTNSPYGSLLLHHRQKFQPLTWRFKRYLKTELGIFNDIVIKNKIPVLNRLLDKE